jgi:hypothetical protein
MPQITTGKYLRREELSEAGAVYKVVSVTEEPVSLGNGESEKKWILTLSDLKPLILNTTNIKRAVAAFGSQETNDWIGKSIVAYNDPNIEYGGKLVGGVRLRAVPLPKAKGSKKFTEPTPSDMPGDIPF